MHRLPNSRFTHRPMPLKAQLEKDCQQLAGLFPICSDCLMRASRLCSQIGSKVISQRLLWKTPWRGAINFKAQNALSFKRVMPLANTV